MDPKAFKQQLLDKLYAPYRNCVQCPLGFLGRKNVVFGEGNPDADLLFVGEAPGRDEDLQGRPFVGKSGQLLNRVLAKVDIAREDVFITNIVKCRPPENRAPAPIEISTCTKLFLFNQIKIIRPKVICTLGSIALNALAETPLQITKVRGKIIERDGMIIIPTYHPAYILRNQTQALVWLQDFQFIKEQLQIRTK